MVSVLNSGSSGRASGSGRGHCVVSGAHLERATSIQRL